MKLIHLSDTHIVPPPYTLYGLDPRERLKRAISHINLRHADADYCVITGDLAHWGEPDAYDTFGRIIADLALPTILLIGNHDNRNAFRTRFPDAICDPNGFVQGFLPTLSGTLVFLDTHSGVSHAGCYCPLRRDWLKKTLAEIGGEMLLFMHHPPFQVGVSSIDAIGLEDGDAFTDIVRPHAARIRHLFSGHVHRSISGSWLGIPFSIVPGQCHQLDLDLHDHGRSLPGSHEPPAYAVVLVGAEQVVVHVCEYLDVSPRFPMDANETKGRDYALQMRL